MEIVYLDQKIGRPLACVATIGFFDGVHRGHRHIIDMVLQTARREGLASAVVTFAQHPRQVLNTEWHPQLLSTIEEKTELLSQTGIDYLVVLQFDKSMAALTARDFMSSVLWRQLGVKVLVTGYDNRFGRHRSEGFDDYVRYGREIGMAVIQGDPYDEGAVRVSSSCVRKLLIDGNVKLAAQCLGLPYELSGTVIDGEHVGTSLGFPTANLQLQDADKLVPGTGVYAVHVRIDDELPVVRHGIMNIGRRPTFGGNHLTLEAHVLELNRNLYGHLLTVSFIERLREERCFDTVEALRKQMLRDVEEAKRIFEQETE